MRVCEVGRWLCGGVWSGEVVVWWEKDVCGVCEHELFFGNTHTTHTHTHTGAEYGITSDGFFELEDLPK